MSAPRVAYFPDSFHEINGVAHTSRNFVAYAQRHNLPFLCIRAGGRKQTFEQTGELRTLELGRSRAAVRMEKDLEFDALFWRHANTIRNELKRFQPDLIHITGPSELGIFGAYFAWELGLPLVASWHTNVHEYAARRMAWLTHRIPKESGDAVERNVESGALWATARFYRLARVLYAPNQELCSMLERATGRPCYLMQRGVETDQFTPAMRTRPLDDPTIMLGYVGRLSIEKNVALLTQVEQQLTSKDIHNARFLIVGHGAEEALLRSKLKNVDFAGVLRGQDLSRAYANMDIFVFPSHTDTFGNVVLEALASGVPAVVTPDGGPRYIVNDGVTGYIRTDEEFASAIASLINDRAKLQQMRVAAREYAKGCSWDAVFGRVYDGYQTALAPAPEMAETEV
jgi:phosphatidylinositol alpha 1,6-mannosyltransferase